ncbi:MAG: TolC family protein [Chitinophagaceae bacterium]|nr:MAG: TolC family protein [Chitinophagaceae bacterium]
MLKYKLIISFLFLLYISIGIGRMANAEVNLEILLQAVYDNSPGIKASEKGIERFMLEQNRSKYNFFPDLQFDYRNRNNRGLFVDPSTNILSRDIVFGNHAFLSSEITIFNGFYNHHYRELSRVRVEVAELRTELEKQSIARKVAVAYFTIGLLKEEISRLEKLIEQYSLLERFTSARVESGLLHSRDIALIRAEVAEINYKILESRIMIDNQVIFLQQNSGLSGWEAEDLEFDSFFEMLEEIDDLTAPVDADASQIPIVSYYEALERAAGYSLKMRRAESYPSLKAEGIIGTRTSTLGEDPFSSQFSNNNYQQIGLLLNVPIFNRLHYKTAIEQAKVDIEVLAYEKQAVTDAFQLELTALGSSLNLLKRRLEVYEVRSEALEMQYEFIFEKFHRGLSDILDLSQIRHDLTELQSDKLQTQIELLKKTIDMNFLKGEIYFD